MHDWRRCMRMPLSGDGAGPHACHMRTSRQPLMYVPQGRLECMCVHLEHARNCTTGPCIRARCPTPQGPCPLPLPPFPHRGILGQAARPREHRVLGICSMHASVPPPLRLCMYLCRPPFRLHRWHQAQRRGGAAQEVGGVPEEAGAGAAGGGDHAQVGEGSSGGMAAAWSRRSLARARGSASMVPVS